MSVREFLIFVLFTGALASCTPSGSPSSIAPATQASTKSNAVAQSGASNSSTAANLSTLPQGKQIADPLPILGELVKDERGELIRTTQEGAIQFCAHIGSRLPSAREFAVYSHSLGAAAPLEAVYKYEYNSGGVAVLVPDRDADKALKAAGYDTVLKMEREASDIDPDRSITTLHVDFYFSSKGYVAPAGEEGRGDVWTSSVAVDDTYAPNIYDDYGYAFDQRLGVLYGTKAWDEREGRAFRCIKSQ